MESLNDAALQRELNALQGCILWHRQELGRFKHRPSLLRGVIAAFSQVDVDEERKLRADLEILEQTAAELANRRSAPPETFGEAEAFVHQIKGELTSLAEQTNDNLRMLGAAFKAAPEKDHFLPKREQAAAVKLYQLGLELKELQQQRRKFLPAFLAQVESWNVSKIAAEIEKRRRRLSELPGSLPGGNKFTAFVVTAGDLRVYDPYPEERSFLQDLLADLEACSKGQSPDQRKAQQHKSKREIDIEMEVFAEVDEPSLTDVQREKAYQRRKAQIGKDPELSTEAKRRLVTELDRRFNHGSNDIFKD